MTLFLELASKIAPLYLLMTLGFVAGRYLQVSKESIAKLLIYIIAPAVVFNAVFTATLSPAVLFLPVLFYVLCCGICLVTYALTKNLWQDSTKNILAFSAGSANVGYFGLPVTIALFGPEASVLTILTTLGFILFENTLGFFITARGNHTVKQSLERLLKLPTVYAFAVALALNWSGLKLEGQSYADLVLLFKGAYTVLGMMLIGLGLASIQKVVFDLKFISVAFLVKFGLWPVVVFGVIYLDKALFNFFSPLLHQVMMVLSVMPMAANTVAYATELKAHPEKVALAVVLSTVFALVFVPLIAVRFLI